MHLNILGDANAMLLTKYIEIDTTFTAPLDTTSKMLLSYDNPKRNSGIDLTYYSDDHGTSYQYVSTFFHNGADTLPFKKKVTTPLFTNTDDDDYNATYFYSYVGSLLVMDSTIDASVDPSVTINKYACFSGGIISTTTGSFSNSVSTYTNIDTVYLTDTNGNITSQVGSSESSSTQNFQFTYDNHPNPFYDIQNKIAIHNRYPYYSLETFVEELFAEIMRWKLMKPRGLATILIKCDMNITLTDIRR